MTNRVRTMLLTVDIDLEKIVVSSTNLTPLQVVSAKRGSQTPFTVQFIREGVGTEIPSLPEVTLKTKTGLSATPLMLPNGFSKQGSGAGAVYTKIPDWNTVEMNAAFTAAKEPQTLPILLEVSWRDENNHFHATQLVSLAVENQENRGDEADPTQIEGSVYVRTLNGQNGDVNLGIPTTYVRTLNGQNGDVSLSVPTTYVRTINGNSGDVTLDLGGGGSLAYTGSTLWVDSVYGDDQAALPERADKPYYTIAAAIAARNSPYDVVVVRPGYYNEQVIMNDGLVIQFQEGAILEFGGIDGTGYVFQPGDTDGQVKILGKGIFRSTGGEGCLAIRNGLDVVFNAVQMDCVRDENLNQLVGSLVVWGGTFTIDCDRITATNANAIVWPGSGVGAVRALQVAAYGSNVVAFDVGSIDGAGSVYDSFDLQCVQLYAYGDELALKLHDTVGGKLVRINAQKISGSIQDACDFSSVSIKAQWLTNDNNFYSARAYFIDITSNLAVWWFEVFFVYVNGAGLLNWSGTGRGYFSGQEWYMSDSDGNPMINLATTRCIVDVVKIRGTQQAATVFLSGGQAIVKDSTISGALPVYLNSGGGKVLFKSCNFLSSGVYSINQASSGAGLLFLLGCAANLNKASAVTPRLQSLIVDSVLNITNGE